MPWTALAALGPFFSVADDEAALRDRVQRVRDALTAHLLRSTVLGPAPAAATACSASVVGREPDDRSS
jgi:hypothetical protein